MLKDKTAYEMNRDRYVAAGKADKEKKDKFRRAIKPNKGKLH